MTVPAQPMVAAPVTLLDIYTRQVEMGAQLGVIHEQLRTTIPDHEQRIRVLEAARWKIVGGTVVISALVSSAGTWVAIVVGRH